MWKIFFLGTEIATAHNTALIAERMTWSEEKKADYERELARLNAIENSPEVKRRVKWAWRILFGLGFVFWLIFSDVRSFFW
jgi:hypothetical protein